MKQIFFRKDEQELAEREANRANKDLYAIVDKRTKAYLPLMFVIGLGAVNQMRAAGMFRRMWVARLHSMRYPGGPA